jgi:hypothetical protein
MTLRDQLHIESATAYIERFESRFEEYVNDLAGVFDESGPEAAKPAVQALVNAYHDLCKGVGPVEVRNYNTLVMLVTITGATLERSSENESLNILKLKSPSA